MNTQMMNQSPTRFYLGTPQTTKMVVHTVGQGRNAVITQGVFTNTTAKEAKLTLTVNTIDIMHNLTIGAGETKVLELGIVLESEDTVSLQQDVANAINVTLNGSVG